MNRVARAVAAAIVGVALLAVLLGNCRCPDPAAAPGGEHGCCVPEAGLRSADPDCCGRGSIAPQIVTAPPGSVAHTAPAEAPFAGAERRRHVPILRIALLSAPTPPTVLRV